MDNSQTNLSEFEEFLKRGFLLPPGKTRFYVYWVDRFLKYYQHRPSKPLHQIIASYIEAMETDSRFADWQVKQAADAILLYAEKYLKSDKKSFPQSMNGSIEMKSDLSNRGQNLHGWKEIFLKLHENMRLRHYSPRTEKSYRIWINKFQKHLNDRNPLTLDGKDVKDYLSYLALRERVSASTQNQAFNALLFLFRNILNKNLSDLTDTIRARQHSFATHLLEAGYNIRTIQELMGHKNVNATMIYTHVARKSYSDISSPLDKL